MPCFSTAAFTASTCSSQPVVPITMLTPSAAMPSTLRRTAAGMEKSMATSMPRKFSAVTPSKFGVVEFVQLQRHGEAVLGRELFDQPAHLAVADDGQTPRLRHGPPRCARRPRRRARQRTRGAALPRRARRSASPTTKLMFSSDAPCEIMRMLMPSRALKHAARHARSVANIVAHQADDRLVVFHVGFGELPQFGQNRIRRARCCRW